VRGEVLKVPVQFANKGRTSARSVFAEAVIEIVPNREKKNITFDYRWAHSRFSTGMIPPEHPEIAIDAETFERKITEAVPHPVSPSEVQDFLDGTVYFAIYARVRYKDIFGVRHWVRSCIWSSKAEQTWSSKCASYPNEDND